jgi:hypothetical protein
VHAPALVVFDFNWEFQQFRPFNRFAPFKSI